MKRKLIFFILFLTIIGIADTSYLTLEHFLNRTPLCINSYFVDCGAVLKSSYSTVYGVPLALLGFSYYVFLFVSVSLIALGKKRVWAGAIAIASLFGFFFSLYLLYLQIFVIGSICLYCTLSGLVTMIIFLISNYWFGEERKFFLAKIMQLKYKYLLRRFLFLFDSETIHKILLDFGEKLSNISIIKKIAKYLIYPENKILSQKILNIVFTNPIGLAAGFDYEAKLTQSGEIIGFGFQTVGTITNMPYEGNTRPRLGRLVKSKSLLVNKGFMNFGIDVLVSKLKNFIFPVPIGISIGKTNVLTLKTQRDSINDICEAFKKVEKAKINNSYYELNISCPNLHGNVTFYPSKNLEELLVAVDKLNLSKPVFVKMPIDKSDKESLEMLEVISKHKIAGVIFGNLQKDRKHPGLHQDEVAKYPVGNFSGKPTYTRSNELIGLTYKKYKKRFIIIGCGGVFSAQDAFEKIANGATLIQMITGLIFEGPTTPAVINYELADILEEKGYKNISEAIGSNFR